LCQKWKVKLIFRGAYRLSGTGIVDCVKIIDVGCNLKQFDGLTWLTLTPPPIFTTAPLLCHLNRRSRRRWMLKVKISFSKVNHLLSTLWLRKVLRWMKTFERDFPVCTHFQNGKRLTVMRWLQLRFDFDSTAVRRPFDRLSKVN